MFSNRGLAKLQAAVLVAVVIAAVAVGAYYSTTGPSGVTGTTTRATTSVPKPVDKVAIQLNFVPRSGFVGFEIAVEKGFYRSQNMEPTINPGQGGVATVTNVAAGQFDFGYADAIPVILARSKGADVKVLAALYTDTPMGFDFLIKSGIKTPKDFEGKAIATFQGSSIPPAMPLFCAAANIDCSKLKSIDIAPAVVVQSLLSGQVEVKGAFLGSNHEVTVIEAAKVGEKVGFIGFAESGLDMYGSVLFATEKTIREKPDLVKRFVTATVQGFKYAVQNPDEAVSNYLKYHPEVNRELIQMQWQDVITAKMKDLRWTGAVDSPKMVGTVNLVQKAYNLTAIDPQSIYTNQFIVSAAISFSFQPSTPIQMTNSKVAIPKLN